jgi:hypothetical protein
MNHRFSKMVGVAVLIVTPLAASAQTYDYTGQGMSGTTYGDPWPYSPPIPGGLQLDGTITLSAPLAPNLVDAPVTPTYAVFSLNGYSAGGPAFPGNLQFGPTANNYILLGNAMDFSTNSSGQITAWNIELFTPGPYGYLSPPDWSVTSTSAGDTGTLVVPDGDNITDAATTIASNTTAGSWAAAPEISSTAAFSGILLLLGGVAILRGGRKQPG